MLSKLVSVWDKAERRMRRSFGDNITDPHQRRLSWLHYHLFDHAFLRVFWTNFWEVAPGVYRSNQPTHGRFRKYARMGIKTVLNLRGPDKRAHYLFEQEICEELGLKLIDIKLHARRAFPGSAFLEVLDVLRREEKPILFHCKSGADRTSTVAVMYLIAVKGETVAQARRHIGLKYIHLKWTKTGVQDYLIDVYDARNQRAPIGLEDWLRDEYHHKALQAAYDAGVPAAEYRPPA